MRRILSRLVSDLLRLGKTVLQFLLSVGARRWVVRTCSILVIGIALSNVLLPAIARAQFAAQNGLTTAQIIAALVGQTVTAERFVATASTGSGYACNSVLASCIDLGPGANDPIGTNVGGDILLGGGSAATIVRIGDSTMLQNGSATLTNGALNVDGSVIRNNSGALGGTVHVEDSHGLMINSTTPIKGVLVVAVTINIGSIDPVSCNDITATVAGVEANDFVSVTPNFDLGASALDVIIGNPRVTNAGTDEVTFRACNTETGGSQDPTSGSYLFYVVRP